MTDTTPKPPQAETLGDSGTAGSDSPALGVAGSDPEVVASRAAARVAEEAAVTAQAMVDTASVAATKVASRASSTAEAAVAVAAETAADIVADAGEVAEAMLAAAAAAAKAAEKVRRAIAAALRSEASARLAMTQTAEQLSVELARRKETEVRLIAQEAELTAFAGMVAHDLKAPLRAVGGYTWILREKLNEPQVDDLSSTNADLMDKICASVDRMTVLIEGLLAYATARDRTLHPQPVDLQELVAQIVAEYTAASRGETAGDLPPTIVIGPLPCVEADPLMCRQLLGNLIGNALKYTAPDQPAYIQVTSRPENAHTIRVEVVDHGIGVPNNQHEKVFDALHRAHAEYPGTGLGLSICRRIVDRHGGEIGVHNNPGGGSYFYFTLPADRTGFAEPSTAGPAEQALESC